MLAPTTDTAMTPNRRRAPRTRANIEQGKRLRALRTAKGLNMSQVARAAKLTREAIRLLERGQRAGSIETIRKLAGVLGVSLSDILK